MKKILLFFAALVIALGASAQDQRGMFDLKGPAKSVTYGAITVNFTTAGKVKTNNLKFERTDPEIWEITVSQNTDVYTLTIGGILSYQESWMSGITTLNFTDLNTQKGYAPMSVTESSVERSNVAGQTSEVHKITNVKMDSHGNWIKLTSPDGFTFERKITYY